TGFSPNFSPGDSPPLLCAASGRVRNMAVKTVESVLRQNLLRVARAYARRTRLSLSTVSDQARGDNRFFAAFERGEVSITIRNYAKTMLWFSDNWPGGTWPKLNPVPIDRPKTKGGRPRADKRRRSDVLPGRPRRRGDGTAPGNLRGSTRDPGGNDRRAGD